MDSIELLHHFDLYIFRCSRSSAVLKKIWSIESCRRYQSDPLGHFPPQLPNRQDHLIQSKYLFLHYSCFRLPSYSNSVSVADFNMGTDKAIPGFRRLRPSPLRKH